ncbi:Maf family protein [Pseudomaricurvus sp.]|uniref:Maf family protein n=1 Tax=Pseudomaricurvus sp. TaxID=2004510 RepID=UPI003F6B0702
MRPIVLASSSKYRRQLLEKLGLSFVTASPEVDESQHPQESPQELAQRLSKSKAQALAERFPAHLIIGSDQVAEVDGTPLGKPLTHDAAIHQLSQASGKLLKFHTGLALLNSATGHCQYSCSTYEVQFRTLSHQQIDAYLKKEEPYDCAGSFKSEGLGIALFEYIRGDDPNSLVGLPLIELTKLLLNEGIDVLDS